MVIEKHYGRPMDIEWAKDGQTEELFIVQARPETVASRRKPASLKTFTLKGKGRELVRGQAIGSTIGAGGDQVIFDIKGAEAKFRSGNILVTDMTDPDWVPIMKRAAGIVTDHGGRTSHAAIVSRELGVPAVVGTGNGTHAVPEGEEVTLSCAEGELGRVYAGILDFEEQDLDLARVPQTRVRVMMNLASPDAAFRWWQLPAHGVGLHSGCYWQLRRVLVLRAVLSFDQPAGWTDRPSRRPCPTPGRTASPHA